MKSTILRAVAPGLCSPVPADTLTLKSGKVLQGAYQGGDSDFIRFRTTGGMLTVNVTQVVAVALADRDPAPPPSPPGALVEFSLFPNATLTLNPQSP